MSEPVAYRLSWVDYSGRQPGIGLEKPKVATRDFAAREAAESARAALVGEPDELVACITPVFLKPARPEKSASALGLDLPLMTKRFAGE